MSDDNPKVTESLPRRGGLKVLSDFGDGEPMRPDVCGDRIETDTTAVRNRAEELHPALWRGKQWAVTEYGIEALDGTYAIEARRLTEDFLTDYGGWIRHMGEKGWVDIADFTTAFMVAAVLHGHAPPFNRESIMRQYRKAVRGI